MDWDRVIRQLNKDIIAANDFLPDDKQVPPLDLTSGIKNRVEKS